MNRAVPHERDAFDLWRGDLPCPWYVTVLFWRGSTTIAVQTFVFPCARATVRFLHECGQRFDRGPGPIVAGFQVAGHLRDGQGAVAFDSFLALHTVAQHALKGEEAV
jgi:hypothetical protein